MLTAESILAKPPLAMFEKYTNLGRELPKEPIAQEKCKGELKPHSRARPVEIKGERFETTLDAAKAFNVSPPTVRMRCNSDRWEDWIFLTEGKVYVTEAKLAVQAKRVNDTEVKRG